MPLREEPWERGALSAKQGHIKQLLFAHQELALARIKSSHTLILDFPISRAMKSKFVLIKPVVYVILLWQPSQLKQPNLTFWKKSLMK